MINQNQSDLDILKQYRDSGISLGVYDSGAVIAKGDDLKHGFTQIKSLAECRGGSAGRKYLY